MMIRHLICIGLMAAILSGCTTMRTFFAQRKTELGASFESAKTNQILNPDASENLEPVTGFDGQAAQITIKKYREGFERRSPKTVYSISIGGTGQR